MFIMVAGFGLFSKYYVECKNYSSKVGLEEVAKFKEVNEINPTHENQTTSKRKLHRQKIADITLQQCSKTKER